jgi:hypothetical protein
MRAVFRYGVSYQDLIEVMRALYTFGVRQHLHDRGRPAAESTLALMAGVTRGEVIKLIARRKERHEQRLRAATRMDQLTLLLGKWHDDPRFSTPYGAPLDLSLQPEGAFRTFDELIEASGTVLNRTVAMDSLRATGCVEVHANKFVRCVSRSFRPAGKDFSKIVRMGRVVGALNSNFVHNLFRHPDEVGYFERTMLSDFPLSKHGRDVMLSNIMIDGEDFIGSLDKWVSTEGVEYSDPEGKRYGVTMFFFEDEEAPNGFEVPSLAARDVSDSVDAVN